MSALTLIYDSHCPLCTDEMKRLARWDKHGKLAYLDMHGADFNAADYGTTMQALDAEIHAITPDGRTLIGIDVLIECYALVGKAWIVWPLKWQAAKPVWRDLYRWFARNRYRISGLLGYGYGCPDGVCKAKAR